MIRIEHGLYVYGGFRLAIDLAVPRGSLTAVLGPSGAGKSTLLAIIAGFEPLRQGRVQVAGEDVTELPPAQRPLTMVFQDNNTFAHLDAWTNVALGVSPALKLDDEQRRRVDEALAQVGLSALAGRKPGEMSGGERQRIALARMLVRNRPVVLLDEPFAALGPGLRAEMLAELQGMQKERGLTILMVTHQPEDARAVADRVCFVDGGAARPPMATADFFAARADAAIAAYLGGWRDGR
jgi:thiamine transport system ATP-binding protein